jgi:hypothetical protein
MAMTAPRRVLLILIVLLVLLLFLAVPGVSWADTLEEAAKGLARRIAAGLAARQDVALEVQNLSSLSVGQAGSVRRGLESELTAAGHRVVAAGAGKGTVRVRVSENLESYLIVAEVPEEGGPAVSMATIPKSTVPAAGQSASSVIVRKELVLEQEQLILDFELAQRIGDGSPALVVLEPERLVVYGKKGQGWERRFSLPIPDHKPWPRDVRGWIRVRGEEMWVGLPGLYCRASARADSLWRCGETAWPETSQRGEDWVQEGELLPGRNYFRAWTHFGGDQQSSNFLYYSTVRIHRAFGRAILMSGLDNQAVLLDLGTQPPPKFLGWGSEIAGVASRCGSGRQVLVTRPGDWTEPDAIQAYEIVEEQATAVGAPVQFDGPVMALWSAGEEAYARAVVRNLKTGNYEAYRLTIACGE